MNQVSVTSKASASTTWQRGLFVLLLVAAFAKTSVAQFDVINSNNPPYDPERLIEDVFLGDGVEVLNVQYDGTAEALGYFTEETGPIGFSEGIVLTTGQAATDASGVGTNEPASANAQVSNMSGIRDPNLETIVNYLKPDGSQNIHDVARYTITFIPKGDRVKFRYVFASEEYPEFVCSDYNDIFGFFIDGPGFSGPFERGGVNLAVVPGTNLPVTINSINPGTHGTSGSPTGCGPPDGSLAHSAFYVDNAGAASPVYDGMTTILTAEAAVTPCQVYTIQITLGDVGDGVFDSGVFLEAKSFSTPVLLVDVQTISLSGDVAEDCSSAQLTFEVSEIEPFDRTVPYTVSGTATPNVDYDALPGVITIPAGVKIVSVPITAYQDNLVEGPESIVIDVATDQCTNKTLSIDIVDKEIPPVPSLLDTTICSGESVQLDGTLPITVDQESSFSNNIPAFISPVNVPIYRDITVSGINPLELRYGLIARVCVDLVHNKMEDLDMFLFAPNGNYLELSTDNGGSVPGNFSNGCFTSTSTVSIKDPAEGPVYSSSYLPEGDWDDLWNDDVNPVNGDWRLQIVDDENGGSGVFSGWSITFEPVYSIDYVWTPSTGLSCSDCPNPIASPTASTNYTIEATDTYGCAEMASVSVDIFPPTTAPTITCTPSFDSIVFSWNTDPLVLGYEVNIDNSGWVDVGLVQADTVRGLSSNQTVNIQVRATGNCESAISSFSCTTQNCSPYTLAAVTTDATCNGASDGSVTLTPSASNAPFTYTVDGSSNTTGVFNTLQAGTYTATVIDAGSCPGSAVTFTIGEPTPLTTGVAVASPTVCGDPFVATATGSSAAGGPYSFMWTGGLTGPQQDFTASGTYYVTVTDNAMCSVLDSAVIVVPEALSATFSFSEITCPGADDGSLSVAASNGTGVVQYGLDGVFGASPSFAGLAPGSYVLSARDAIGCVVDTNIVLADPVAITLTMDKVEVGCNGASDGKAWVSVANARGPVTYTWTGFTETSDTLRNLPPGMVYVTVQDSAGCVAIDSIELFEAGLLTATIVADSVACFGESNGALTVSTLGGRPPYSFTWSTGITTTDSMLTGLPAGPYTVDVNDGEGCNYSVAISIGEPAALNVFHQARPITCSGSSTGEIDITVTGGTRPYVFAWADGPTTEDRTGLASGTYDLVVTDANNCTFTYQVLLQDPGLLTLNANIGDVTCFGSSDGTITTSPAGGRSPYNYVWSGPNGYSFFGSNPVQLAAGDYFLNFTDDNGCVLLDTFTVNQPNVVTLQTSVVDSICFGSNTGRAFVTVAGGTPPFQYLWDNGEAIDTAYALAAGEHIVEVTDGNNCVYADTITILSLPEITLEIDQTAITCYGDSNGVAEVVRVNYGNSVRPLSSMSYEWNHDANETGFQVSGLGGRQEVTVTATDSRGCFAIDSIVIGEPSPVIATAVVLNDVSCKDGADGGAEVSADGGNPAYTFTWLVDSLSNPTAPITNQLSAGLHQVVAYDSNGCSDTTSVTLREPDSLITSITARDVNCFALNSGEARIEITGGVNPYQIAWQTGAIQNSIDSLTTGDYGVQITDANGCIAADTARIGSESSVELVGEGFSVSCNGDRDGHIELQATGGNGPYAYKITGTDFNIFSEFRYLSPNSYAAVAIDRDGCPSDTLTLTVEEPQPLIVEAGEEIELELGESTQLFAQVFNGQGPLEYLWLPNDSTVFSCQTCADPTFLPTFQGVIQVQVIDSFGCEANDYIRVKLRKELQVLVPTGFTPNNDGRDDRLLIHGKAGTEVLSFRVFDRWGSTVFEDGGFLVNDENRGWNGRFKGAPASGGVYIWEAQVQYLDGVVESVNGQTTLIR